MVLLSIELDSIMINCIDIGLCRIWLCMMCILIIKYTGVTSNMIQIYSGITSGRVLDEELLCTKILEVNLFAFANANK